MKKLLYFFFLMMILFSCKSRFEKSKEGNIDFYLSNQIFDTDPVDLNIYINNQLIISQNCYVENQHKYYHHTYHFKKGKYKILIKSNKGKVEYKSHFKITDKHWICIEHFTNEIYFQIENSNEKDFTID